jgi:hypothetical protein
MSDVFGLRVMPAYLQKQLPWIIVDTFYFKHMGTRECHGTTEEFLPYWGLASMAHTLDNQTPTRGVCQMHPSCFTRTCVKDHAVDARCSTNCTTETHANGCTRVPHCPVCGGIERAGEVKCLSSCRRVVPFVKPMNSV